MLWSTTKVVYVETSEGNKTVSSLFYYQSKSGETMEKMQNKTLFYLNIHFSWTHKHKLFLCEYFTQ